MAGQDANLLVQLPAIRTSRRTSSPSPRVSAFGDRTTTAASCATGESRSDGRGGFCPSGFNYKAFLQVLQHLEVLGVVDPLCRARLGRIDAGRIA